jgi:predicted GNAT family acetyltransferase
MTPDATQPTTLAAALAATPLVTARPLANDETEEALDFLAERPQRTFVMSGFIRDNGLTAGFNRGTFYGYRDEAGKLSGVALIGHSIFVETRSDAAIEAFAALAQRFPRAHMIMGEQEIAQRFWNYYRDGGQPAHRIAYEALLEMSEPPNQFNPSADLRIARVGDLDLIVPVHAALAFAESGTNPLDIDADGFRARCRRRIEQGRVFVLVEDDKLIFKADVVSDTPDVIYVEGLYVTPEHRGRGAGTRCVAQMARELSRRTKSIVGLVNEDNGDALRFLIKVGFKRCSTFITIFLKQKNNQS